MSSLHASKDSGEHAGSEKNVAIAHTHAVIIRPNEEQAVTATDQSTQAPSGKGLEPSGAILDSQNANSVSLPRRHDVLPIRKMSLPSSTMDTFEYRTNRSPARSTSGYAGSYHDGYSSTVESNTEDEDDGELVEWIIEKPAPMQGRLDGDKDSDVASERTSAFTIGVGSPRGVASTADGGVAAGFGLDKLAESPSEHYGSGVACRYYNRARCVKGSSCLWSHAPDTYSLRSRPDGKNVCIYYIHNNKCRFETKECNYSHRRTDLSPWDDDEIRRQLQLKLEERKKDLKNKKSEKKERRKSTTSQGKAAIPIQENTLAVNPGAAILAALSAAPHPVPSTSNTPDSSFTGSSLSIGTPTNSSVKDSNEAAQSKKRKPSSRPPHPSPNVAAAISPPRHQYSHYPYVHQQPQPQQYFIVNPFYPHNWSVPSPHYAQLLGLAAQNWNLASAIVPNTQAAVPVAQPSGGPPLPPSHLGNGVPHNP